jgi:hypothetical protein
MLLVLKQAVAVLLVGIAVAPIGVGAQTISPANVGVETQATKSARSPAELTGKERLGEKWKDEQRVDNCNVPLDKRGTAPRPDSCAHAPIK